MGKRKREEDDDGDDQRDDEYVDFCSGLQKTSRGGVGDKSYIYSVSRRFKRPKINPNFYTEPSVTYRPVDQSESVYRKIKSLITNRRFVIDEIVKVKNSVLEDAYYFKKKKKMEEYGGSVEEALLFHGTKEPNVESICKFNFDWRLTGRNQGHKFGKGVNFSVNAKYASSYSDPNADNKVMIVAKVLIGKVCTGHHDMTIPPKGFDTSAKGKNGIVLVKYEDNEFYPAYIIRYHFRGRDKNRPRHHIKQKQYCDGYKYSYNYHYSGSNFAHEFRYQNSHRHYHHDVKIHGQYFNSNKENYVYLTEERNCLNRYYFDNYNFSNNRRSSYGSYYPHSGNYR